MLANRMRIGRFRPDVLLGQDTATETYRARDGEDEPEGQGQHYVLKVIKDGPVNGDGAIAAKFTEAARSFSGILLPGIATPVEIGEGPGPVFAAFPFYEGVDLAALRAQAMPGGGVLDARLCLLLAKKIIERLQPLHGQADGPRVHGGLSPGNILVAPAGDVWLLDCGLSEAIFSRHGIWPSHWQYLSPEQLRGEPATLVSDLYSLGAVLYFLAYGRPPFTAADPPGLDRAIAAGPPSFADMAPAAASVLARLLAYDPAQRARSTGEALRRVSVALLSMNASVPSPSPVPATVARPVPDQAEPVVERTSVEVFRADPPVAARPGLDEPDRFNDFRSAFDDAVASAGEAARPPAHPGVILAPFLPEVERLAADDPAVGAVFDDDDEEMVEEVGPDGKVHRRMRPKSFRLVEWTKSAFARKLFRYAWIPAAVVLLAIAVQGYLWYRSYRSVQAENARIAEEQALEREKQQARQPKLPDKPELPAGHLKVDVTPAGAVIWIDGMEKGTSPVTLLTQPGIHRLVVTANGYRMLRDVVDTSRGADFTRNMAPAVFPMEGSVSLNVGCATAGKYPVFVDGRDIGVVCPIAGIRLEPGRHVAGIFVIPQDRLWTVEREILPERPQRVLFSY